MRKLDRRTMGELERFLREELVRLQESLRTIAQENRTTEKPGLADISVHAAETLHTEIQVALVDRRTQQVVQIPQPPSIQPKKRGHAQPPSPTITPTIPPTTATSFGKSSGMLR